MGNNLEQYSQQSEEGRDESLRGSIVRYLKTRFWHIILLLASSVYVAFHWGTIDSFKDLNVNSLIFIIWFMMLLYPLFSEMEMFGIKLKKEVEEVKLKFVQIS